MLLKTSPERKRLIIRVALLSALGVAALTGVLYFSMETDPKATTSPKQETSQSQERATDNETYPEHTNITATVFWVGEDADDSNKFIHNRSSAWVEDWESSYGGVDDPENRCDFRPCAFTPKENPFYFALPYNDLDDNGKRKASAQDIPWFANQPDEYETILKNRWIKVTRGDKVAYAQWEDVGPFGEDDMDYVFGDAKPSAPEAGLDLSPAAAEYLGVDGRDVVRWKFVEKSDVPDGPWLKTITQ